VAANGGNAVMGLGHSPRIVTDGLVLCLDAANKRSYGGSGTTWTDRSTSGRNGTLSNTPTFNDEDISYFSFDGSNDFVGLGDELVNLFTDKVTVCAWFKTTVTPPASAHILAQSQSTSTTNYITLFVYSDGKVYFQIRNSSGTPNAKSSEVVTDGVWRYAVGVSSGSTNNRLYLNGELESESSVNLIYGGVIPDSTRIGCWIRNNASESNFFNGDIGLVKAYNRALTADEIRQNYLATKERYA
jgi:hypothetical protein